MVPRLAQSAQLCGVGIMLGALLHCRLVCRHCLRRGAASLLVGFVGGEGFFGFGVCPSPL
jgi:hypothetical protein